jgi:hypothetical protein
MSTEREVEATARVPLKDSEVTTDTPFAQLSKTQKRARIARILERGLTADRLSVKLPDDMYGEWVPRDAMEIERMRGFGFEIDTQYAVNRSLHPQGTGEAVVGDVIFMVAPMETKEIIDEIRTAKFEEMHGSPNQDKRKNQKEEREAVAGSPLPIINESVESSANADHLKAALFSEEPSAGLKT